MIPTLFDKTITIELAHEAASQHLGASLASHISAPLVMAFNGEIGAGKTTIIRSFLQALGVGTAIKSPTFSIVESYLCHDMHVHHFDLYRIHHEEELEYIGFRDYFSKNTVCCIEWAIHARNVLPPVDIRFNLSVKGAGRELQIIASSDAGKKILDCLVDER